jgi:trans-L-3-hydroxyproline dehydratase
MGPQEVLINESVIGSLMTARMLHATRVGAFDAVVPEVSGSAHVYGEATWMLDRHDPLRHGFLVR